MWLTVSYAAATSLQSCLTLCDLIEGSPPGSLVPEILQARTLEWVAISFSNAWKWKEKVKSLSRVRLLATPWTAAFQAPPSMGFSRQEYWSGVPLPLPIFDGIFLNHKKEWIWISWTEVHEPKTCYTQWSKKEKNKYCIFKAYTWNLKRWYQWIYLQGRSRDTDVENGIVDKVGGRKGWEELRQSHWNIYITTCKTDS